MDRPNIVFILSDQHNPLVCGFEGDPDVRTPNLDRLSASGTSLTNAYCGSPLCVPSRMSMLTGLLPSRTGVFMNQQSLHSDTPTFVHSLTLAGYETTLCGRMHFVGPDQRHGYMNRLVGDLTHVRLGVPNPSFTGFAGGTLGQSRGCMEKSGPGNSNVIEYDKAVLAAAVEHLEQKEQDGPFFVTIGFYGPHCSYICPRDLFDHYMDVLPPPDMPEGFVDNVHPAVRKWFENRNMIDPDPEAVRRARAAYYGLVELTDDYVGRIVVAVNEHLDPANTLIVYSSDHGDVAGHNGLFWKSNFYEGSVRVPFVFSMPGTIAENRRIDAPTSLLDLGPTLIDLAGAEALPESDGVNLMPYLTGDPRAPSDRAVVSMLGDSKGEGPAVMVRKGPWKLVQYHGYEKPQLFNLDDDPGEQNDLASDPSTQAVRQDMAADLEGCWDGDAIAEYLARQKEYSKIIAEWNRATPPPPDEELWRGDPKDNYIAG